MKYKNRFLLSLVCMVFYAVLSAQPAFQVVPLGVKGGMAENNLSAYMLAPAGDNRFICLDAGTVHAGLEKAVAKKTFRQPVSVVLKTYLKAYFISHGHLDHLAGMVINSPEDSVKNIYAMPYVLKVLRDKYFSWQSWANFADSGEAPLLKKYHYKTLDTIAEVPVENTDLFVKTFILSHGTGYNSTAFLVRHQEAFALYLGDTGADTIEHSSRLLQLWQAIAPLVKAKQLKGIFIETSFPNQQPDNQLFGHLTPKLLMHEMGVLHQLCGGGNILQDLPLIVTHIKPAGNNEADIKKQLKQNNPFKMKLVFPKQGKRILL